MPEKLRTPFKDLAQTPMLFCSVEEGELLEKLMKKSLPNVLAS